MTETREQAIERIYQSYKSDLCTARFAIGAGWDAALAAHAPREARAPTATQGQCPTCGSTDRKIRKLEVIPPRNVGNHAFFGWEGDCTDKWHALQPDTKPTVELNPPNVKHNPPPDEPLPDLVPRKEGK